MKKLSRDSAGFDAIELLLIIVVVGLIGGVGWYVWQSKQSKPQNVSTSQETNKTQQQPETKPTDACDASYKSVKNEKIGISFCYPEGWSADIIDTASNHNVWTAILKSPDYKEIEGGFGGSNTGSTVYVSVAKIDQLSAAYISVQSILDGTEQSKMVYSDVKAVKIAGKDGVTYISAYEGPRYLINEFEYKGNQYTVGLKEDLDGPKFNDNQYEYEKIVNSLKLKVE